MPINNNTSTITSRQQPSLFTVDFSCPECKGRTENYEFDIDQVDGGEVLVMCDNCEHTFLTG